MSSYLGPYDFCPYYTTEPLPWAKNKHAHPPHIISEYIDVPHGFFGRRGGDSVGSYASLNGRVPSHDSLKVIDRNYRRVGDALGVRSVNRLRLAHGNNVDIVSKQEHSDRRIATADISVTCLPGVALSVTTADCLPLLAYDPFHKVIGVCHAGRRGLHANAPLTMVCAMVAMGATPETLTVVIGPHIATYSYSVHDDVRQHFGAYEDCFIPHQPTTTTHQPTYYCDLAAIASYQLQSEGVSNVIITPVDTYRHKEDFFSYRRIRHESSDAELDFGAQISAIALPLAP